MWKKLLSITLLTSLAFFTISCDSNSTKPSDSDRPNKQDSNITANSSTGKTTTKDSTINTNINSNNNNNNTNNSNNDTKTDVPKPAPEEVKELPTETRNVRLYYNNYGTNSFVYVDTTVKVVDKAMVKALVGSLQKPLDEKYPAVLNQEVGVRTAKLDKANDTLIVDFGANFVTSQNLGSGAEADMLQSLTNTLGYNLGVNNVIITVNGKPYVSGHISKKDGESFKVSYSNYKKY